MTYEPMKPGILCMSITTFNREGKLDEGALREHLRRVSSWGIGVNLAGPGFGEALVMNADEVCKVYEIGVKECKGKVPVFAANLEHHDAAGNIEWAGRAQRFDLDAVQIYPVNPGHTIVPTRKMFSEFYDEVLTKVTLPVMLSSNIDTGFEVPMDLHAGLLDKYPQIIGWTKIHHDTANIVEFMQLIGRRSPVLTEDIDHLLITWALGAKGWHSWAPNLSPGLCKAFYDAYMKGDMKAAMGYFDRLFKIQHGFADIAREWSFRPVCRAAMNYLGLPGGYPRKPYLPVEDAAALRRIQRVVDEADLRTIERL